MYAKEYFHALVKIELEELKLVNDYDIYFSPVNIFVKGEFYWKFNEINTYWVVI